MSEDLQQPDELEQVFTEPPADEPLVYPLPEAEKLQEINVALETLTSLSYTIRKEGVSRHDISALHQTVARLQDQGLSVAPSVTLENYGLGSFTSSRSLINEQVSQEAIVQTVVQTIKAWIQALIDYVIKTVRWFNSIQHRDERVSARIDMVLKRIEVAEQAIKDLTDKTTNPPDLRPELLKFAAELLNSTEVKRNGLTAAAFGVREFENKVRQLHTDARAFVGQYNRIVLNLEKFLTGKVDRFSVDIDAIKHNLAQVKLMNVVADDLSVEQPAFNYVAAQVKVTAFEQPFTHEQRTFAKYEFLLATYQETADILRKVKSTKFDVDDPDAQALVGEIITTLNAGLLEVGKLVNFFSLVNETHLRVLGLYYRYTNKRYTLTLLAAREGVMAEIQQAAIEKIHKWVETQFTKYGV